MKKNLEIALAVATVVKSLIGSNLMGASLKISRPLTKKDIFVGRGKNKTQTYSRFFNGEESVITKVTEYTNVTFERSYKSAVINRILKNLKKQGISIPKKEIEFESEPLNGMIWVKGYENILTQGIKNSDQYYLRVAINANSTIKTTYLINDREATKEELDVIKTDLNPKKTDYSKQHRAGVAVGDEVKVFTTKIENIHYIKRGLKVIILK